jgi:hypothetical protein
MPSFDDETIAYFARMNFMRRKESAFRRGRPSPEDMAWLKEQLQEAEEGEKRLADELKTQKAWAARLRQRIAKWEGP